MPLSWGCLARPALFFLDADADLVDVKPRLTRKRDDGKEGKEEREKIE